MSNAKAAETLLTLASSALISLLAYAVTSKLVKQLGPHFLAKGLGGVDKLKVQPDAANPVKLPEPTGVIGAGVYICLLSLFAPVPFYAHILGSSNLLPLAFVDIGVHFPHHSLTTYLAALLSLLTATFLGFLDDVFDIRWRYKLPIPIIASVPLLVVYLAGQGVTDVLLPDVFGLRKALGIQHAGGVLKLGPLYYLYMSLLSTFCTNSINILAGVNGVEVGQSLVIAISIAVNDLLFMSSDLRRLDLPAITRLGLPSSNQELLDRHLFSFYFTLPLIGVCLALLRHNWYPAHSFVGDTFCYFAGMAFAVVGILGHFSKTLLLFFIPQIFNFLLSTPQLFGLVPNPRHRMPILNAKTGLLEPSYVTLIRAPSLLTTFILRLLSMFGLVHLRYSHAGEITATSNLTLISCILVICGPIREDKLTVVVMGVQAGCSVLAFGIRYAGAGLFYGYGR